MLKFLHIFSRFYREFYRYFLWRWNFSKYFWGFIVNFIDFLCWNFSKYFRGFIVKFNDIFSDVEISPNIFGNLSWILSIFSLTLKFLQIFSRIYPEFYRYFLWWNFSKYFRGFIVNFLETFQDEIHRIFSQLLRMSFGQLLEIVSCVSRWSLLNFVEFTLFSFFFFFFFKISVSGISWRIISNVFVCLLANFPDIFSDVSQWYLSGYFVLACLGE
jgi:hypothetical protein